MGAPEPAGRGRLDADRRQACALRRRPRDVPAPGEDRDGDLAAQDDRVQLLLDAARRGFRPQGRSVPPRLPQRPVLLDRPLARARRRARLPALADPRQGLLRDQGRARLRAPRGLRPPRLRLPRRLADGRDRGDGEGVPARADRLARRARLRRLREGPQGDEERRRRPAAASIYETEYASGRHADLLGARLARERRAARARRPREGRRRAAGAAA